MPENDKPQVNIKTSMGNFVLELDAGKSPATVENFLSYVNEGFYNGTVYHRVIPGFMIQGGGFDKNMQQKKTKANIRNEAGNGLKNNTGTVAMARTSAPHSASSQFFINMKDNDFLNFTNETPHGWGYTVFGKVIDGMDVVQAIEQVKTGNHGAHQNVPLEPIIMHEVQIIN